MAAISAAVVAAVVLAVVFTRPGGGSGTGGEVFLQSANSSGQDPFTASTAKQSSAPPPPSASAAPTGTANAVQGVDGGAPGLYGGTRRTPACDVGKQVKYLQADQGKEKAFASVVGVQPSGVPAYLRSLTPVQLRVDTRVTNHGYRNGAATSYQSVLQAGTAVLVDSHGVPRVRCACGNPLNPPVALKSTPKLVGHRWPSYRPSNVVVVTPAPTVVNVFVLYDSRHKDWIQRQRGDQYGRHDEHAEPPKLPHPWNPPRPPSPTCPPGSKHCPSTPVKPSPSTPSSSSSSPSPSTSSSSSSSSSPSSSSSSSKSSPSQSQSPSESKPSEPKSSESQSSGSQSSGSQSSSTKPSSAEPVSPSAGSPSAQTTSEKSSEQQTTGSAQVSSESSAPGPANPRTPGDSGAITPTQQEPQGSLPQ